MRASVKGLSGTFTGSFFLARRHFFFVLDSLCLFWQKLFLVSISGRPLLLFHQAKPKMASFLGSIFGFEVGAKIYLFWSLWQVIPDWLVLDATGCEQSELLLLCCGSISMIPAASLWNKSLATGCSMMVYPWVATCCLLGFKTMQRNCRGTSKCLQSCWGLEKLVLVSWKCHAVA